MSIEVMGGGGGGLITRSSDSNSMINSRKIAAVFFNPIPTRIQSCRFRMIRFNKNSSGNVVATSVLYFSFGGDRIEPQAQVACGKIAGSYATSPLGNFCGLCDIRVLQNGQEWDFENLRFADNTYIDFPTNSDEYWYAYEIMLYGVDE